MNLNLPNLARSYLFGSKNKLFKSERALSTVGGSPGLNLLYTSRSPSSSVFELSFCIVALIISSSPKCSIICMSVPYPRALTKTVTGSFLVRSILTESISLESVSYSSQAPLLGITVFE